MKFFAVPVLVASSLLIGAIGGSAVTLFMVGEGYMTVEKDENGKVIFAFNFENNKNTETTS